jgi:predicted dithiol-disulfide oxidoreductase (DUF899 family)
MDYVDKNNEEWMKKRLELLEKEKEFTKLKDEINNLRQKMPWVLLNKYNFFN